MPEEKGPEKPKSLEMRVAELEDKLSKLHITEEEWKTYQKVTSAIGTSPDCRFCSRPCHQISFFCFCSCLCGGCIRVPRVFDCFDCTPMSPTGGAGGGGFGTLGM